MGRSGMFGYARESAVILLLTLKFLARGLRELEGSLSGFQGSWVFPV